MATIGVDLGGTKTLAVLVEDGEVIAKAKKRTPREGGPDDVVATIAAAVTKVDPDGVAGTVGLGVPGPVRPGSGIVAAAPNLPGFGDPVDVRELVAKATARRVLVDNDVNVATLAEHRRGAGRGCDDMMAVFVGTGVGAGLVLDGSLRRGPRGMAGEIGHSFVAFDELRDAVVGRGELEDHAGRRSLERRARAAAERGIATELIDLAGGGRMKSSVWAKAIEADDDLAHELVAGAASALASAFASVIAVVDIERIVVGGGMAERLGDTLLGPLTAELAERSFASTSAEVVPAQLGDVGGALGAALLTEA